MASEAEVKPLQQPAAAPPTSGPTHRRCWFRLLATLGIGALAVVLVGPWRWAGGSAPELPPPCTNGCANFSHALWSSVLGAHLQPNVRSSPDPSRWPAPALPALTAAAARQARSAGGVTYSAFDYEGLAAADADFRRYLAQLAAADVAALSPSARMALFLNAYNALAVAMVIDNRCDGGALCDSIRDIGSVFSPVWQARPLTPLTPRFLVPSPETACNCADGCGECGRLDVLAGQHRARHAAPFLP